MRFKEYLTEQDQFFKTKEEIDEWMSEQDHNGFMINDDLTVDIHEDFKLKSKIKLFPVQFGEVNGNFNCSFNNLTSLKGAPREVNEYFSCYNNDLTSLKGAPREVGGTFWCSFNNLTSLNGAPKEIGENFWCYNNNLTSLKGAPREVGENFWCYNNNLTSLEGAPREVHGDFDVTNNKFKEEPDHSFIKIHGEFIWK